MQQLIVTLLAALTLTVGASPDGHFFYIQSDTPQHCYIEITPSGGAQLVTTSYISSYYEVDIAPGEMFGRSIVAYGPGEVTIRVWAGDQEPSAVHVIELPTHRVYMPLF